MTALGRKLVRELWQARRQVAAIALLVACAVASFVASVGTWRALQRSQLDYYEAYAFPHVFAELRRAPEPAAAALAELPGVAEVETRVAATVAVEVPGLGEPASALLSSVPDDGAPRLSRLHLRAGRSVASGRTGEVVVSENFASANALTPGARLFATIGGRRQTLTVVGVALSPEHLFVLRPGAVVPDDRHYGILWMARSDLAAALDLRGAFNSVAVRLAPGASAAPVVEGLDRLLARWGGGGAYDRTRHPSHRYVSDEIGQLRAMAVIIPGIFLGVAAFLLGVVLSRLVAAQRTHLGTLKALGYGDLRIGVHYASFAVATVLAGAALGTAGGLVLGVKFARAFAAYYRFPSLRFALEPGVAALATLIAVAAGLAGVAGAVRRAVRLPPAAAMRPEAPPNYRPGHIERLGLGRLLSPAGRMIVRDLRRRPVRTALSSLGIALAVGTTMSAMFMRDATDSLVAQQFDRAGREDVTVTFTDAVDAAALLELRALPGVTEVEGWRAVGAMLRASPRSYRTALLGVDPGARLHRAVDAAGRPVAVPPEGLLVSRKLAEMLEVSLGDRIRVEVLEGARPAREVAIVATVDDALGVQATLSSVALGRLLGEAPRASGAWLATASEAQTVLSARLGGMPRVASVSLRSATLPSLRKMLEDSLL